MMIGSITKSHLWPEKFILDPELELDSFLTSTEDFTEEKSDLKDIKKPVLKSSDGDYNNLKSKKLSRKIKRETHSKSTPELSLTKEEEL